ncbi:MAG: endonuclease/exonuclease/phosphatase family protein [Caulobacteraceae bacterium]
MGHLARILKGGLARRGRLCYGMAMSPIRILAASTAAEMCFGSAVVAVLGLGGAVNGWLDLFNCLAPLLMAVGLAGAAAAAGIWPRGRFRIACLVAGLAAALYGALLVVPDAASRLFGPGGNGGAAYRVVTANVFRDNRRPARAMAPILDRRADAVIVEEANGAIVTALPMLAAAYPYSSDCPGGGVRIWLKTPILAQGCGMKTPPGTYPTWGQDFAWVRTMAPDGRPIVLAGVHLGRPYPPRRQAVERQALADALAPMGAARVLVAGDLNTASWTFGMRRTDGLLRPLIRRTSWPPTYPALIGTTQKPWPIPFLPIDHVYAGAGWVQTRMARFPIPGSDHLGLQLDARLR